jgi:hypothetical protein
MGERGQGLEVWIRHDKLEVKLSGSVDEVIRGVLEFIGKVYPSYELVSRLTLTVDFERLLRDLENVIAVTPEGLVITVPREMLSEREGIRLHLLRTYVGYRLGRLGKDSMSIGEILAVTGGKAGAIAGRLSEMVDDGWAERVGRGEYRVTTLGVKQFCDVVLPRLKGPAREERKVG